MTNAIIPKLYRFPEKTATCAIKFSATSQYFCDQRLLRAAAPFTEFRRKQEVNLQFKAFLIQHIKIQLRLKVQV
jgi:hypothetical protein